MHGTSLGGSTTRGATVPNAELAPKWLLVEPRSAVRVQIPLAIVTGKYEKLTDEELEDHYNDIKAERSRRSPGTPAT